MKKFEDDVCCPKCGLLDWRHGVEYTVGVFDEWGQKNDDTYAFGANPKDYEYLLRTCRRCNYKWSEKVVDNEDCS